MRVYLADIDSRYDAGRITAFQGCDTGICYWFVQSTVMSESIEPDDFPSVGAAVWPPPPTGSSPPVSTAGTYPEILEFPTQNGWLLFLLMAITWSLYGPFWMIRTIRVANRIAPERLVQESLIWTLFAMDATNLTYSVALWFFPNVVPKFPAGLASDLQWLSWLPTILWWYLLFRIRGNLNYILKRSSPSLSRIGGVGTFFFGELFLQIRINQRIRQELARRQMVQ